MWLKSTIKNHATNHIAHRLRDEPGTLSDFLKSDLFKEFIPACRDRLNQLDIYGHIPSKRVGLRFIEHAVCTAADKFCGNKRLWRENTEARERELQEQSSQIEIVSETELEPT